MKYFYLILILLLIPTTLAMPVEDVKLTTFVNDYTNILTSEEINSLNTIANSLKTSNQAELAIVIVDNFNDLSIEEYSMKIAHENLGDAKLDNGLLILVGLDVREFRVEVGYGLEGILNDAKVARLSREKLVPFFQQEKYGQGLIALSYALHDELSPNTEIQGVQEVAFQSDIDLILPLLIYFVIICLLVFLRIYSAYKVAKELTKNKTDDNSAFAAAILASLFLRGGGGGRGGFSGGGGGFSGGGGFGGGGFSGGW